MKVFQFLIFSCFLFTVKAQTDFVQNLSLEQEKQIDSLFMDWGEPDKPGVVAALLYNNQLVYQKSFGAANVECEIPLTAQSKFQLAGMSRHYLAYGALLLEHQGKLNLNDRIDQFLPELCIIGKDVSVIDLLRHSDGFLDHNALYQIKGIPTGGISNHGIINTLTLQNTLNFEPGTDYVFSDTGLIILAEVISKVTGQPFSVFMKKEVFEPIGMFNTEFAMSKYDNFDNVAKAYGKDQGKLNLRDIYDNIYGPSNLFSSLEDLIIWELHLLEPKVGDKTLIDKLNSPIRLKNDKEFNVPGGRLTLGQQFIHRERDIVNFYHVGQFGGFASSMFKFPEQGFTGIILSNTGTTYNGYLTIQSSAILLKDDYKEPPAIKASTLNTKAISREELDQYTGTYWDHRGGFYRTIERRNDSLFYVRINGNASPLYYLGHDRFQLLTGWDDLVFLQFDIDTQQKSFEYYGGEGDPILFEVFKLSSIDPASTEELLGNYYNTENQVGFVLIYEDRQLVLSNSILENVKLTPIKSDLYYGNQWNMRCIQFVKGPKGKILGFKTAMDSLNGLFFKKI